MSSQNQKCLEIHGKSDVDTSSLEHNRSLKIMNRINKVVNWTNIDALLREHYEVGRSKEGADAFPPLMLLKGLLLQKWFRIPSDPELENQINERISNLMYVEIRMLA